MKMTHIHEYVKIVKEKRKQVSKSIKYFKHDIEKKHKYNTNT